MARRPRRSQVVRNRLPVSELAFDRAGAGSPFGDDLRFPLPVEQLTYVHPGPETSPAEELHGEPEREFSHH
ncbi:MAG: hypothetical protein J2P15_07130 [Micromonosporaceae bacterium]|nr:hypothetical protein [Micromonosporaceae bacterium]